ncbi:hypothetical protein [Maridesulfovibrio zosterae]|uniref:hypothetical protein n=1 Tax=Maridesulfovibrio zosterae TaxID=82171 RepID=UPI0004271B7F|nr:hypothetical protein [Maridesulfovibrio zosterae]
MYILPGKTAFTYTANDSRTALPLSSGQRKVLTGVSGLETAIKWTANHPVNIKLLMP